MVGLMPTKDDKRMPAMAASAPPAAKAHGAVAGHVDADRGGGAGADGNGAHGPADGRISAGRHRRQPERTQRGNEHDEAIGADHGAEDVHRGMLRKL